jgi:hypothetical protein
MSVTCSRVSFQLIRRRVGRERQAVAIEDQPAVRRNRLDLDAVALREIREVVVLDDLQPHQARDHRAERDEHDHRGRDGAALEQPLLGVMILDADGAGHGLSGPAIPGIQDGDEHRPQQRAGEHRNPAHPGRDREADDTVGPEHHEFVQQQQQEHGQRLLRQREDAHAQLELVRQEAHQQEGEGVLTERRALQQVDGHPAQPREHEPGDARCAERPVDHQEQQQVRTRDVHPVRQRQHGEESARAPPSR